MQALKPGSTIGILGAGQLGRMLAAAASQLGFKCRIYSDVPGPLPTSPYRPPSAPTRTWRRSPGSPAETDVVTYEFENVPVEAAAAVDRVRPVRPGLKALEVAQDRLKEKQFAASLGIPIARFAPVANPDDFAAAIAEVGAPADPQDAPPRLRRQGPGVLEKAGNDLPRAFEIIGRRAGDA